MLAAPPDGRHGSVRPTYAEIDLAAVAHNLACVRRVAGHARVYAVIKADAYGHGLVQVAKRLEQERVDGLCVALAEEGFHLREAQVGTPILVLNGAYGHSHAEVLRAGLTPVVYELDQARAFSVAAAAGRQVRIHLKVDTGMARLGVTLDHLESFLTALRALTNIRIDGVMTHFASADVDRDFTLLQCQRFVAAVAQVRAAGHAPRLLHVANTEGTYADLPVHYDIVRVGLALYGVSPEVGGGQDLRPAMRVVSQVLSLRVLPPDTPIGYGGAYRTRTETRVATVPIGYGDGYLRAASNRGAMLVRGQLCPIVGRVSMDLITLDVSHLPVVEVGDEVVVLGAQGDARLTAGDLARAAATIPYEVLCNLSARVPRVYR